MEKSFHFTGLGVLGYELKGLCTLRCSQFWLHFPGAYKNVSAHIPRQMKPITGGYDLGSGSQNFSVDHRIIVIDCALWLQSQSFRICISGLHFQICISIKTIGDAILAV